MASKRPLPSNMIHPVRLLIGLKSGLNPAQQRRITRFFTSIATSVSLLVLICIVVSCYALSGITLQRLEIIQHSGAMSVKLEMSYVKASAHQHE